MIALLSGLIIAISSSILLIAKTLKRLLGRARTAIIDNNNGTKLLSRLFHVDELLIRLLLSLKYRLRSRLQLWVVLYEYLPTQRWWLLRAPLIIIVHVRLEVLLLSLLI